MEELRLSDEISGDKIHQLINKSIVNITEIIDDLDT